MTAAKHIKRIDIVDPHIVPAGMAELADARDIKSRSPKGSAGSTPAAGMNGRLALCAGLFLRAERIPNPQEKYNCKCSELRGVYARIGNT